MWPVRVGAKLLRVWQVDGRGWILSEKRRVTLEHATYILKKLWQCQTLRHLEARTVGKVDWWLDWWLAVEPRVEAGADCCCGHDQGLT